MNLFYFTASTWTLANPITTWESWKFRKDISVCNQWFFFSRDIRWLTPEITNLFYLRKSFLDQSIPNKKHSILKKEALYATGLSIVQVLDVTSNKLSTLEGLSGLTSLHTLLAASNQLTSLEQIGRLNALTRLDASYNHLTNLNGLSGSSRLLELHISGNMVTSLQGLPRSGNLLELQAASNQLTTLIGLAQASNRLDVLNVSNNPLQDLRTLPELLPCLTELTICGCTAIKSLQGLTAERWASMIRVITSLSVQFINIRAIHKHHNCVGSPPVLPF